MFFCCCALLLTVTDGGSGETSRKMVLFLGKRPKLAQACWEGSSFARTSNASVSTYLTQREARTKLGWALFSLSQERAKIAFSFLLHFFLFSLFSLIFFFSLADADGFHFFDSAFVGDVILHLCFFLGDVTAASDFVGDGDLKIAYGVPNVLLVHE